MGLAHNIDEGSRTQDIKITQDVSFDSMLLTTATLLGLKDSGFFKPSPVQLHGIPLGKCGFDLILEAKSGTGKTAVFTIVALEKLDLNKGLQVIILAPTREIAAQICDVIKQIGSKFEGLVVEVVMGGFPVQDDIIKFKKNVHIVVGSPGRLRHLIQDKHINISAVRFLVFDEADKLMEKSFQADINFIFSILPDQKQVILSSATYTETTKSFVSKYVKSAQHIRPNNDCILLGIDQKITKVKYNANIVRQTQYKFEELLKILSNKTFKQCLIFCNYQARVTELYKLLSKQKWPTEQLYGQQKQSDRLDALKTLQDYKCRILISTDLAARGIDASNVDVVINFEPPLEWQTYLHRIGRAGRYGSYGMSITILSEGKEEKKFMNLLQSMSVPLMVSSLWTNDEIDLNTTSQVQMQTSCTDDWLSDETKNKYNELWNEFTCNLPHDTEEIKNFDELCQSFDADTSGVQSFNDLLMSFNDGKKHLDQEEKYQHLQIKSKVIEDLCKLFNKIKSSYCNSKLADKRKSIKIDTKSDSKVKSEMSNDAINRKLCNSTKQNYFTNNYENIGYDTLLHSSLTNKLKDKNYTNNVSNKDSEMMSLNTQIEASLPVHSVSTNKLRKKDYRYNVINQKSNVENLAYMKESVHSDDSSNTFNLQQSYSSATAKINNKKETVFLNSHKITSEKLEKQNRKMQRNSYQNEKEMYSTDKSNNSNQNYINWYAQLKYRMKQIQIALYIEEMSHLYVD